MDLSNWFDSESFSRIFSNRFDTLWWFGEAYHKKYGQKWPFEGQEPPEGYVYPSTEGIKLALVLAVVLTIVRYSFERLIAEPIGSFLGLKHKYPGTPAGPNATLEAMITKTKRPSQDVIKAAAKEAGIELREAEVWVRRRQRELMPSKLNKFKETLWKLVFYSTTFGYGVSVLWNEPFTWNTSLIWVGYPDLIWAVKKSIYYYYLLEGSFYLSLMVSQFIDTKRKDFWEMFLHHIATLTLIGGSWMGGCYKIGALVMALHDISDVFLESAKIGIYLNITFLANGGFAGFAGTWIIFRLFLYPTRILFSAMFEAPPLVKNWPALGPYCAFLSVLQVLHIYWFTFIVKLFIKIATGSDVDKDNRSDDETPPSSETEAKKDK